MGKNALIIVDPQTCFADGGKYSVSPFVEKLLPSFKTLSTKFDYLARTRKIVDMYDECEDIHKDLKMGMKTFYKNVDSDKVFTSSYDSLDINEIQLEEFLIKSEVEKVFMVGFVDENVKETAIDCSKKFETYVIVDCVKYSKNIKDTIKCLIDNDVNILNYTDLKYFLDIKEY